MQSEKCALLSVTLFTDGNSLLASKLHLHIVDGHTSLNLTRTELCFSSERVKFCDADHVVFGNWLCTILKEKS